MHFARTNLSKKIVKSKQWNFDRTRKETHIVKDMKNKFMDQVKAAEDIANKERVRKKQLKNEKCLKSLWNNKRVGGTKSEPTRNFQRVGASPP